MTLNEFLHTIVKPSISALGLLPKVGDMIDFATPGGNPVLGAMVTKIEDFCGTTNFYVEYSFIGRDGREHPMYGWVALEDVL